MAFYAPSGAVSPTQLRIYQVALRLNNFGALSADDIDELMGPKTAAALRAFQAAAFLPVTGTIDAATAQALDSEIASLNASGRNVSQLATMAAAQATPARRPAAVGTHPKVNTIATSTGTVAVPEAVSKMIPPATVATLQTMTAPQAQSFVNDLSSKVATGQVSGNELVDGGTGKNVEVTAVPMVSPNGTVTAALATQPAGWWAGLTDNEKAAWVAGGTLGGVALIAGLVWLAKGK